MPSNSTEAGGAKGRAKGHPGEMVRQAQLHGGATGHKRNPRTVSSSLFCGRYSNDRRVAEQFSLPTPAHFRHLAGMGKRREARERAVQFLFQHDLNPPENLDAAIEQFWESQRGAAIAEEKGKATWGEKQELPPPTTDEAAVRLFADPLIRGAIENREECDALIRKYCKNWDLPRIAAVDRNVLRLAIYEMLHREDIPPVVSINEAVDIAKRFSTQDSGKFINGILDSVKAELMRPARVVK